MINIPNSLHNRTVKRLIEDEVERRKQSVVDRFKSDLAALNEKKLQELVEEYQEKNPVKENLKAKHARIANRK